MYMKILFLLFYQLVAEIDSLFVHNGMPKAVKSNHYKNSVFFFVRYDL